MPYTNSEANAVVAHKFGGTALAQATAWWIALFTTLPGADGTGGVEVSDANYSRQNVESWTLDTANRRAVNATAESFGTAAASVASIVGFAIMSAETGGTVREYGSFTNPQAVDAGQEMTIEAGAIYSQLPA